MARLSKEERLGGFTKPPPKNIAITIVVPFGEYNKMYEEAMKEGIPIQAYIQKRLGWKKG